MNNMNEKSTQAIPDTIRTLIQSARTTEARTKEIFEKLQARKTTNPQREEARISSAVRANRLAQDAGRMADDLTGLLDKVLKMYPSENPIEKGITTNSMRLVSSNRQRGEG